MQVTGQGAARQQVDAPASQLARALTAQHKSQPARLHEPMDLVKQLRHTLDFVHYYPAFVILRDPVAEPLRRGQQLGVGLVIEQIEKQRVGKLFVRPRGLADPARPKQEKTLLWRRLKQSWILESFLPSKNDLSILICVGPELSLVISGRRWSSPSSID